MLINRPVVNIIKAEDGAAKSHFQRLDLLGKREPERKRDVAPVDPAVDRPDDAAHDPALL